MLVYWIYQKENGDLELRSFHGIVRDNENPGFHNSPRAAIESYRQNLMRQEAALRERLRKNGEDAAKLMGLEEEAAKENDAAIPVRL